MFKKLQIITALFLVFMTKTIGFGQSNLVLNPSFEEMGGVDSFLNWETRHIKKIDFPKFWSNPSITNRSVLVDGKHQETWQCPIEILPKSGKNMIEMVTFSPEEERWHNPWDAHGYCQGELKEHLEIGTKYDFQVFVTSRDTAIDECYDAINTFPSVIFVYANNIGVLFSEKRLRIKRTLDTIPHINETKIIVTKVNEWIKIEGTFIADKPYRFFTMGNFFKGNSALTSLEKDKRPERRLWDKTTIRQRGAIYYFDDVQVMKSTKQPMKLEKGKTFVIENIFFETGKSELLTTSFEALNKLCELLKNGSEKIEIQGHTDNQGLYKDNNTLSLARAKAVYDFIISRGIDKEKLTFKGFGATMPIGSNLTPEGRQSNRRVQIFVH